MKFIIFLFSLSLFLPPADWSTDIEKAKKAAAQDKKLIVLNFSGSDWCIPCIKMKKEIFESSAFTSYASKNLVLVRADFPRLKKNKLDKKLAESNQALAEKYNPKGKFPFTVLLDANGAVLKSWEGLPQGNAEAFVNSLKK